jgi:hypothetical protein
LPDGVLLILMYSPGGIGQFPELQGYDAGGDGL